MRATLRPPSPQVTISEQQLREWTRRAYRDEDKRAQRSERLIRRAVAAHPLLAQLPLSVYAKGSYRNNTNVRRDSDIDVVVEYTGIVFLTTAAGVNLAAAWTARGLTPYQGPLIDRYGNFDALRFKAAVGEALSSAFGPAAIARTDKVFTVAAGPQSLPADVVPCVSHDHHFTAEQWVSGVQLLPDRPTAPTLLNFPQQHLHNGVAKNVATTKRFKRVVRILKNLENGLVEAGLSQPLASYFIESLVFNCPRQCFAYPTWAQSVRAVLLHIDAETRSPACQATWLEVNGVKRLFATEQPWTRDQAYRFVAVAWPYVAAS